MKIGYLYNLQAFPPIGGNRLHAYELCQQFHAQGCEVHVVGDPTMPNASNHDDTAAGLDRFLAAIDILYVRIDSRPTAAWNSLNYCAGKLGGRPMVWEINSPATENLAFSWLGGDAATSRFIDRGLPRLLRRALHAGRLLPGMYREEAHRRRLAGKVAAAVCVSSGMGRYARERLGIGSVRVLPNGGPLVSDAVLGALSEVRRPAEAFTVLYMGSPMYPWQGFDVLCQTIELAARTAPDIHFVIATNEPSDRIPATPNVTAFTGLDREGVKGVIGAADACISLSPQWPWSKWGFHLSPMKLYEYMAYGKPVITSNHSQMKEVIGHRVNGLLCDNTPADILEKILYLKSHPQAARDIGRRGLDLIRSERNWVSIAAETRAVFESAVDGQRQPVRRVLTPS